MNNEIKEILRYLRIQNGHCSSELSYEETHLLLDYIINLQQENERLNNIIKDIKSQLDYLETYSSKEDVFEDMKRRLNRIESIVNRK